MDLFFCFDNDFLKMICINHETYNYYRGNFLFLNTKKILKTTLFSSKLKKYGELSPLKSFYLDDNIQTYQLTLINKLFVNNVLFKFNIF